MIKSLKSNDVQVTPFIAKKTWNIQNKVNLGKLLWVSGSTSGSLSHIYIDYGAGDSAPITNSYASLAYVPLGREDVIYQRGAHITGTFYPLNTPYYNSESNPVNRDGTYHRMVYDTYRKLFYNTASSPVNLYGLESLNLNDTIRILTDKMDVFKLTRNQMGEKIIPNSVIIYDTTGDVNYTITDDGRGNLKLSGSFFSTYQRVASTDV